MESPPTYTDAQLEAYLKRIDYPNAVLEEVREKIKTDGLATLSDLQRRHLCAIPWGNSGLHYSQSRTISLHPETLFEKIVERRLDGYCMENTGVLFIVLRSLGFHVYATGGRVSCAASTGVDDGRFNSIGHMILIVVINGEKYMVDVGLGNNCATAPLPLREGATATHIGTSEMRLIRDSLVEFIDKEQKVWIYQTRYNSTSVWVSYICFSDVEFLPQDFAMINFSVSQNRTSWFGQVFVCMRMIMDQNEDQIIGQYVMSGKEVKKRVHGKTEILQILHNEKDRIKALAKYFGMSLRQSEIQGIQGLTSEIR
ncbi:hypothetical protein N7486_009186 [Penicillium sp. IBT 16267x]|nr:hypothetical protein N7486_009186 [Penicillium sp. IBT 16267x]